MIRAGVAALFATAGLLALSACDGGSATQARDHSASASTRSNTSYSDSGSRPDRVSADASGQEDHRSEPVKLVHGKPMWAANRRHSADENAEYQFNRDGADFGAKSVDDFVTKTHAFVDRPPSDALTLTRNNGDKLIYDPKANVFAVVSKDGAPRTMFKPRDGEAYWEVQKQRVAAEANGSSDSYRANGDRSYGRKGSGAGGSDDQG